MSGIDMAIESVTKAKNRFPTDQLPNETGPDQPVEQAP
jgi:hypothetical protein